MKFKKDFLKRYLNEAPVPLAYERAFECLLLSQQAFEHPILDVGCGDGIFAHILFDEKIDTGIDPLNHELKNAAETGCYEELIQAYADNIPKPDNYFQTVFSNSVLEHIPNLDPVLKEVHRVLKPGGSFYVTIPTIYFDKYSVGNQVLNKLGLKKAADAYSKKFNSFWKHYHFYSREQWTDKFNRNGFTVANVIEYGAPKDCLFNNMMMPLAVPNWIVKKAFNRFFLFPAVRKLYSRAWASFLDDKVKIHPRLSDGGLIFFELKK